MATVAAVAGASLVVYQFTYEPGLWALVYRSILAAIGANLVVYGCLVGVTGRYRPLTPSRALWFPVGVVAVLAGLFGLDVWQLGFDGLSTVVASTFHAHTLMVATTVGIPLGTALRYGNRGRVLGTVVGIVVVPLGASMARVYLVFYSLAVGIALVLGGTVVGIGVGALLTAPVLEDDRRTTAATG